VGLPKGEGDVLRVTATDPYGEEIFTWSKAMRTDAGICTLPHSATMSETADDVVITAADKTYVFSKQDGRLRHVRIG
jgi:hypothetical protein